MLKIVPHAKSGDHGSVHCGQKQVGVPSRDHEEECRGGENNPNILYLWHKRLIWLQPFISHYVAVLLGFVVRVQFIEQHSQIQRPRQRHWRTEAVFKVCVCSTRELDPGLQESVSTLIWAAPRLQSEVAELKIVSSLLYFLVIITIITTLNHLVFRL